MKNIAKIFIVEDDPFYSSILESKVKNYSEAKIHLFNSIETVQENLFLQPDLIFLDYFLNEDKSLDLLKYIKSNFPHIHVIMISSQESVSVAVESLKYGALDYLIKGEDDSDEILGKIINVCEAIISHRQKAPRKSLIMNLLSIKL